MDRKALLAVAISLVIWVGWQKLYLEPFQRQAMIEQQAIEAARQASLQREENKKQIDATGVYPGALQKKPAISANPSPVRALELQKLDAANQVIEVSNGPTFFQNWLLKDYTSALEKKEDFISLAMITGYTNQLSLRINEPAFQNWNQANWQNLKKENFNISTSFADAAGSMERSFSFKEGSYFGELQYKIRFHQEVPKFVFLDLKGNPKRENDNPGSIFGEAPDKVHFTYRDSKGRNSFMADGLSEAHESQAGIKWFGIDTRYFVLALAPEESLRTSTGVQIKNEFENGAPYVRGSFVVPTDGKKELDLRFKLYFGPKQLETLVAADPVLSDTIDFGFTSVIAIPLLKALKWFYSYVHNYGIAIILLTALIKILLYPLTYKSMKSMAKMAKLTPQLNALREKYKDDKEKLNTEMMSFMRTNGYNPASGCLPILLQMPIFFALYRVFFNSMELYQAPFFGWIVDLSARDHLFITPVILSALMYLQQKLSPTTATDPMQQKMLQFMPVMFGVFMLMLPSGLNIYMIVNSIVSIAQQYYLNRKFGIVTPGKKTATAS